jgi:uncharacterized protein YfaQ (DUF2300 family)
MTTFGRRTLQARTPRDRPATAPAAQDGIEITADRMTARYGGQVVATARFGQHAAADGGGAWIVSTHPARVFCYNQAITALTLAERLSAGHGDDDPFVGSWRGEIAGAR